ncbi:hypothetical protein BBL_5481 [Burkholderia pseudomallei MSHR1328]|nr:hypothetical protein Y042_4470 [Burkholderia pseudomallei MSHR1357]KGX66277.1 hypothetical protein Y025_1733 [Burkholderia pseudomallei TSV32]KKC12678.1 hypothetical protein BBL_5481 [Burkholderia pseudomallei MSHR1328]OMZ91698.1 hypothetical protein AQ874_19600 [Burkholderia pseudomallei]ONB83306.1 hypothetical protein AQ908_07200 [Burkholderia pseudomallei]
MRRAVPNRAQTAPRRAVRRATHRATSREKTGVVRFDRFRCRIAAAHSRGGDPGTDGAHIVARHARP